MHQPFLPPQLIGETFPEQVITILRGSVHLRISDIIRLEADRNYTRFILIGGRQILTSRNLSSYESLLPASFVRVHKSCIINRCLIIQKNKTHIRMSDGAVVEVSRRKRRMTESVIG